MIRIFFLLHIKRRIKQNKGKIPILNSLYSNPAQRQRQISLILTIYFIVFHVILHLFYFWTIYSAEIAFSISRLRVAVCEGISTVHSHNFFVNRKGEGNACDYSRCHTSCIIINDLELNHHFRIKEQSKIRFNF